MKMKRRKTYSADDILLRTCRHLSNKRGADTASSIAKEIGINPKTAQKYLVMGTNLGILVSDELYKSKDGRCCLAYWIAPKYLEIFKEL